MPDLTAALAIAGWMHEVELRWLAEQAATRRTIVEVGSWMGRSTRALADHTHGTVWAVDTWQGSEEHQQALAGFASDYLYQQFLGNVGEHVTSLHVIPLRLDSVAAAALLGQMSFDMIFIDAAHDYASVKADILAWRPRLAPGGLLCGHDFDAGRPGVVRAVRELVERPMVAAGSIWYESHA